MGNQQAVLNNQIHKKNNISLDSVLNAISTVVIVLDLKSTIILINTAAENFLQGSENYLKNRPLNTLLPKDNPVFSLIKKVREQGFGISENKVILESPRIGRNLVNLQLTPLVEDPNIIMFKELDAKSFKYWKKKIKLSV